MANLQARGQQRDKPYRDALRMAIADAGDNHKALRRVAAAHLSACYKGDVTAIKELADRLDGKVPQAVVGDDEHPPAFAAWLAWMNVLQLGDNVSPARPNDINGLVAIEGDGVTPGVTIEAQPASSATIAPPVGPNLVPSGEEETSAP